jgi:lysophospholipase L1-like esterase
MRTVGFYPALVLLAALSAACANDGVDAVAPAPVPPAAASPASTVTLPPPSPAVTEPSDAPPQAPGPAVTGPPATEPPPDPLADGPRFLALGDSYTIGQSVDADERWPAQLVALLRESGVAVADPEYIAQTGWRTSELAAAVDDSGPEGAFGLVSLQIGVNNQFGGGDIDVFRSEFSALLDTAIELAGGQSSRVIVLTIPDWGATPFAPDLLRGRIAFEIGLLNDVVAREADARGVALIDVTPSSKLAEDDPSLLAFDDLHPSGKMYAQWASLAFEAAREALSLSVSP